MDDRLHRGRDWNINHDAPVSQFWDAARVTVFRGGRIAYICGVR